MILVVNPLDKACRDFLEKEDVSSVQVLSWDSGPTAEAFMKKTGLSPSSFPAAASLLPATGGLESKWILIDSFKSLPEAQKLLDAIQADREKAGAKLPPLPPKPDVLGFLTELNSNQQLPIQMVPYLALFTPEAIANPITRQGFWARILANKLDFMTPEVIGAIESMAISYNLPLTEGK